MTGFGPSGPTPQQPGGWGPPQGGQGDYSQGGQGGYPPPAPGQGGYPQGGYGQGGYQQGGYQQGGGYGQAPRSGFNFAAVNPFDWGVMGAAVLAFIFSFISYYTANADASGGCPPGTQSQIDQALSQSGTDTSATAWHGFFGWFGTILALVAAAGVAVAVFAPRVKLPGNFRLIVLGALALATLSTFIALFVDPVSVPGPEATGIAGCSVDLSVGHGFGYWASLILILAAAVVAYLRFQQLGGTLPGIGGSRTGGAPAGYYPPPGYGTPPQPPAPTYGQPGGYSAPPQHQQPQHQQPTPQQGQQTQPNPVWGGQPQAQPQQPAPQAPQPPARGGNEPAPTQIVSPEIAEQFRKQQGQPPQGG